MSAPGETPDQNRLLGILLRLGAATSFSVMAAAIKTGHEAGISTVELVFYRFAFGLPPLALWMIASGQLDAWRTQRPMMHVTRGLLGLAAMTLAFSALGYLPLAEATTIGFVAPLFAVMLSALLLSERVGRHRWSAVILGFAGVILVMQPAGTALHPIGLVLAIGAAFAVGAVTIAIRAIGRTESAATTVLWFTGFSLLASGMLMPWFAQPLSLREFLILVVLGLSGGAGQLFLTGSLRKAPVAVVVPFDYVQLLWAVLLGWLLWQDRPPASTWAGAAVIVASGLYTVYREHRLGRDKPHPPALQP